MNARLVSAIVSLSLPLGAVTAANAAPYIFAKIDVPGALSTSPSHVNAAGQILGRYVDSSHRDRIFLWHEGTFTMIDPPGAVSTSPVALNDAGQVLGSYLDSSRMRHGFLWHDGAFTPIDHPDAGSTSPVALNDAGQVVGGYKSPLDIDPNEFHGFLWEAGTFTTIDPPEGDAFTVIRAINAAGQVIGLYTYLQTETTTGFLWEDGTFITIDIPAIGGGRTFPSAINDAGWIVGHYDAGPFAELELLAHAFLGDGGTFTTIDPPGSDSASAGLINAAGQIVGGYANLDPGGHELLPPHTFLLEGGTYTTIEPPEALSSSPVDINDGGQIVGSYFKDPLDPFFGRSFPFLWDRGTFTPMDFPGSASTSLIGINNAGEIAGGYKDSGGVSHSFLARPADSVNGLVHLGSVTTSFSRTPVPGGPAGTFTIEASFANTSSIPIGTPQFVVTQLSDGNLLLNADLPPGTAGARLTPDVGSDAGLSPGESFSVEFVIGLQERSAFTFFVDLLGVPQP